MNLNLKIENVSKSFFHQEKKIEILKNVDLDLESSMSISIVGPSGSGKSTFLSLVGGLEQIDAGKITVLGQDLSQLSESSLRRLRCQEIGYIFQKFHLLNHLNALENIALPALLARDPKSYEKAEILLEKVHLGNRREHSPSELSGGECQRVAIARSLINNPSLLLADEPSGNLDQETGDEVMNLLFNLVKDMKASLILVTHNENLAKQCVKTFKLHEKKLKLIH